MSAYPNVALVRQLNRKGLLPKRKSTLPIAAMTGLIRYLQRVPTDTEAETNGFYTFRYVFQPNGLRRFNWL